MAAPPPDPQQALAVVAKGMDRIRHRLDGQDKTAAELRDQIDALTASVHSMAQTVQDLAGKRQQGDDDPPPRVSWMTIDDPQLAADVMADLLGWLEAVYVRFPDGWLPSCWALHPWVVDTLIALRHAHHEAHGPRARAVAAVDWHEKHRPAVAARIGKTLASCSMELHPDVAALVPVPVPAAAERIAPIWAVETHPRHVPDTTEWEKAAAAAVDAGARSRRENRKLPA